ncbi:hypothetical protein Tco_0191768, partial [Tanacetum coccineum]
LREDMAMSYYGGFWKQISDKRTKKSSKNGQNRARNGKAWKRQSQIEATVKVKVNPEKSKVKTEAVTEEYLMGPPEPI